MTESESAAFYTEEYRLLYEAEWEYAARSRGRLDKYSGGGDVDSVAWYKSNAGGTTQPAGTKQPNSLGIYDMSGNVWEWCWDWYDGVYYSTSPGSDPRGPASSPYGYGVLRGGAWGEFSAKCRSAARDSYSPDGRFDHTGFRCAL